MKINKRTRLVVLLFTFLILISSKIFCVPADPNPIKFKQPNGTFVTILLKGDENFHWAESMDGYILLRNEYGGWEYAIQDSLGNLTYSGFLAKEIRKRSCRDKRMLRRIPKGLPFSPKQITKKGLPE